MASEQLASMSCYQRSDGKPQLDESVVCHADILGFKDKLKAAYADGTEGKLLAFLDSALVESHEFLHANAQAGIPLGLPSSFEFKLFSDNIALGFPLGRRSRPSVLHALDYISTVQSVMAVRGFLLRGGLAVGSHYMDENLVFGSAFIEATKLDTKGLPPRITLTQSARELILEVIDLDSQGTVWRISGREGPPEWYSLLKDSEENLFINYLDAAFGAFPDGAVFMELLEGHRKTIMTGLNEGTARQKYVWAAQYHNFICSEFAESRVYRAYSYSDEEMLGAIYEMRANVGELRILEIAGNSGIERIT